MKKICLQANNSAIVKLGNSIDVKQGDTVEFTIDVAGTVTWAFKGNPDGDTTFTIGKVENNRQTATLTVAINETPANNKFTITAEDDSGSDSITVNIV